MNTRNLLPPHRIAARRQRRAVRRWVLIDGAYLLLLAVAGAAYAWSTLGGPDASDSHEAATDVTRLNTTLVGLKHQIASLDTQIRSIQEVTDRPDWSLLLAAVARTLGEDIVLNAIEGTAATDAPIDGSPQRWVIGGVGLSQGAVTRFVLRIEQLGLFAHVRLAQTAPQGFGTRVGVGFQILCDLPAGER